MNTSDYNFITDRLAIGNVASRATPGFCAVVSLLATQPWDEVMGAPEVPYGRRCGSIPNEPFAWSANRVTDKAIIWLHIDISDGETRRVRPDNGETYGNDLDTFLDDATSFIAAHIRRGCVLVHCGAGKSRSVAVVIAYLCRYAGMSFAEAAAFVAERRPGACPAPCFAEAIKRWLRLDELATKGPREAHTLLDLTKLPAGTVIEFSQEPRWASDHRNVILRKGDRAVIEDRTDGGVRLRITHAAMLITAGDGFGHYLRALQPACIVREDAPSINEYTDEAIAQGR